MLGPIVWRTLRLSLAVQAVVAACLVPAVAAGSTAAPPRKAKSARLGEVRALLTYRQPNSFSARDLRLRIERGADVPFDRALPGTELPTALRVRDLDGDGEPEVLADFFTGGAHCCAVSLILRYEGTAQRYLPRRHVWGNPGYSLRDVERDGSPEFVGADDRFAYRFTAYAASFLPIRIWRYRGGTLADVTRRYSQLVARDAAALWREYLRLRKRRDADLRGVLAAYLADAYVLDQQRKGWRRLQAAYRRGDLRGLGSGDTWPAGRRYLTALRRFLAQAGYARSSP
jgi:hypothetical protein